MKQLILLIIFLNTLFFSFCQIPHVQGEKQFCKGEAIELWAYGDTAYAWANANDPDSIISTESHLIDEPEQTPSYYLYTDNDTLLIEFYDGQSSCYCNYFIPNFFSPDGDDFNDKFDPVVNCEHFAERLTIYSREQLIVFDETDYHVSWDGRNQATGELLANGIYPYIFSFITDQGDKVTLQGFVLLGL